MNWFIYIGGGILFIGFWYGLLSAGDMVSTNSAVVVQLAKTLRVISLTMIWVWLCWKFIR